MNLVYIDGTKLEANANKYSWVWKKSCITNRNKVFLNLSILIKEINDTDLKYLNVEIGIRQEYSGEYVDYILNEYEKLMQVDTSKFVYDTKIVHCAVREQLVIKNRAGRYKPYNLALYNAFRRLCVQSSAVHD